MTQSPPGSSPRSEEKFTDRQEAEPPRENPLEVALLDLIGRTTSVAPRDVAECVAKKGKDWRVYLPEIKSIALRLETAGRLVFVRKGRAVPSKGLKGVYRFARPDAPLKPPRAPSGEAKPDPDAS